jgi:hypothetical protein
MGRLTLPGASSAACETFRDPRNDEQQQPQNPTGHSKGPDKDAVRAGQRVCAKPNVTSPCPCGEHQSKEINGTSGIPKSFEAVLRHKLEGIDRAESWASIAVSRGNSTSCPFTRNRRTTDVELLRRFNVLLSRSSPALRSGFPTLKHQLE